MAGASGKCVSAWSRPPPVSVRRGPARRDDLPLTPTRPPAHTRVTVIFSISESHPGLPLGDSAQRGTHALCLNGTPALRERRPCHAPCSRSDLEHRVLLSLRRGDEVASIRCDRETPCPEWRWSRRAIRRVWSAPSRGPTMCCGCACSRGGRPRGPISGASRSIYHHQPTIAMEPAATSRGLAGERHGDQASAGLYAGAFTPGAPQGP